MNIGTHVDRAPKQKGARPALFIGLFILLIAAGAIYGFGQQLRVALLDDKQQPIVTFSADTWRYHYTHSVQLTPVDEYFRVNGLDDMTMTHTIYQSLGVGLPFAPYEGRFTQLEDGTFRFDMNRPYKNLKFRVSRFAKPYIAHGDTKYDLCSLFGDGGLVEVRTMKRYQLWLNKLKH